MGYKKEAFSLTLSLLYLPHAHTQSYTHKKPHTPTHAHVHTYTHMTLTVHPAHYRPGTWEEQDGGKMMTSLLSELARLDTEQWEARAQDRIL